MGRILAIELRWFCNVSFCVFDNQVDFRGSQFKQKQLQKELNLEKSQRTAESESANSRIELLSREVEAVKSRQNDLFMANSEKEPQGTTSRMKEKTQVDSQVGCLCVVITDWRVVCFSFLSICLHVCFCVFVVCVSVCLLLRIFVTYS